MSLINNSTLLHVKVSGEIFDSIAKINVEQVYKSTNTNPLEITYDFALDPNSIITSVSLQIGERKLIGILNDKYTNSQNYEKAIENKHVALTLEKYYDKYKLKLGNIEPNVELIVKYSYITILKIIKNKYVYSLPTNIAPKYIQKHNTNTNNTNVNNITYTDDKLYDFNINIVIKSVNIIDCVDCNNQNSDIHKLNDTEYLIFSITNPSDGDLVITYTTKIKPCVYKYNEFYYLNFNFPSEEENHNKKIYNILVDRSGSMNQSEKIECAKDSLKLFVNSLPSDCLFNIISFGTNYNALWQNPTKYSNKSIKKALEHINSMSANMGGTELYKCVEACIRNEFDNYIEKQWASEQSPTECYENVIIIITDGQVSGDIKSIFDKNLDKKFRVNTLGVGRDCNKIELESIAEHGNGICRMINESKNISDNVIDILEISNIKYYKDIKYNDEILIKCAYPNMFKSIFFRDDNNNKIVLNYSDNLDKMYSTDIDLTNIESGKLIAQLYMHEQIKNNKIKYDKIIEVSKKYSILTEKTSFFLYDYNEIKNDDLENDELIKEDIKHYNKTNSNIDNIDNIDNISSNYSVGTRVMENLSCQGETIQRSNRFEKKALRLNRSDSILSNLNPFGKPKITKKWCEKSNSDTKSNENFITSFLNLFKSNEQIKKEQINRNKERKAKTDEMRRRYGLLEDDDVIDDDKINKINKIDKIDIIEIIDFRTSDGSFKLCDDLIRLCGFKDHIEFKELCDKFNMIPELLINYVVLIKLQKLNENKYKLIIKYLQEWINKQNEIDDNMIEVIKQYV
jgi:hypothetical protein